MRAAYRGFFTSEMIVAVFIIGLMFSAIVALIVPIVNAHGEESAKSDTVMSAAYGFGTIERDIRQSHSASDWNGIWACTVGSVVTCSQPTSLTQAPYIAVLTADNAAGQFQVDTGADGPLWTGWYVYSQPAGTSVIYRTFEPFANSGNHQNDAQTAVADAATLPNGTTVLIPTAQSMSVDVNSASSQVDFQLVAAGSSGSASNSTRYSTTILLRN